MTSPSMKYPTRHPHPIPSPKNHTTDRPCAGDPGRVSVLRRLEADAARVGQITGRLRNVLALPAVPLVELRQLVDGDRVGHPVERLRHRHEPDVVPAEGGGGGGGGRQGDDKSGSQKQVRGKKVRREADTESVVLPTDSPGHKCC